ncbi:MAG: hypothetical protein K1X75_12525 [Leptospirales bacterium]|nr:hypothetical protein [Leptospirales bacterium]
MTQEIKILQSDYGTAYPQIRYDLPANQKQDWLLIGRMCTREVPADDAHLNAVQIHLDFLGIEADILSLTAAHLLSERAKAVLDNMHFKKRWFRWTVSRKPFYLLLVDSYCDLLDPKQSTFDYFDDGGIAGVAQIALKPKAKPNADIFKIPELPMDIFCTATAQDAIRAAGLIGFKFIDLGDLHNWQAW